MSKIKSFVNNYIPKPAFFAFALFSISVIIQLISNFSSGFSDWYVGSVGYAVRRALAWLYNWLPISVGEIVVYAALLAVVVLLFFIIRLFSDKRRLSRLLCYVLSALFVVYSIYVATLGVGYKTTPILDRLSYEEAEVTEQSLTEALYIIKDEIDALLPEVNFSEGGSSYTEGSIDELCHDISRGYLAVGEKHPELRLASFSSRAKPVLFSKGLTKLEILGIYSFFTGESNVNVHFPEYTLPFSIAHEFAHQRGIARENEANFIAFLVCTSSDNPYVRYSGYMNMFEYIASSLVRTNKEAYREFYSGLDERMRTELVAYSRFYEENKSELLGKISNAFNDTYLKAQGTEGVISYGLVTRLCIAYFAAEER